jgi:K319-like protein
MKRFYPLIIALLLVGGLLTGCMKDCNKIPAIVVNAGPDQTIQLPANSATLTGTVTQGQASTLVYTWSEISGPSNPVISNSTTTTASVSSLVLGTYVFQFQAENAAGTIIGLDTTSITVIPANSITLTIQPTDDSLESHMDSYNNNSLGYNSQIDVGAWTIGGVPTTWREFLKLDLSSIPSNAVVTSATFYLYSITSNPPPLGGNTVDAQYGTANACYIKRITSSYTTLADWNTQPSTTSTDEAVIPQSTSSFENETVDVTTLMQDIITNGNNGFAIEMQNETYYNLRQFGSTWNANAALHPKLVITYH